jgi:NAD(P)-dependent dehydrogenase (short-subunit alcohol dehydrogenase family)
MSIDLSGRVAIVTGGGRGIGRAEALALTAAGARVVVNDLGAECDGTGQDHGPADEVVAAIREAGGEAVANYGDVSLPSTGAALVQQALASYGRLDIVVNNAGILRTGRVVDITEQDWDVIMAAHLKGHFVVAQAAARVFVNQSSGRIINTSSEAGLGMPGFGAYGSAKEGITGLTRTLALELKKFGVSANSIRPRAFTRMFPIAVEAGIEMGDPLTETLPDATEAGLFSNTDAFGPEQVAALVVFLASDAAAGVTGRDFIVGGGEVTVLSALVPQRSMALDQFTSGEQFQKLLEETA